MTRRPSLLPVWLSALAPLHPGTREEDRLPTSLCTRAPSTRRAVVGDKETAASPSPVSLSFLCWDCYQLLTGTANSH